MRWAPFAETNPEPDNSLPNYGTALSMAKLVKVTDAPTYAEAKQYGDDELAEYVSEFTENPVDVETTDLSNDTAAAIYGAKIDETSKELSFDAEDNAPYGGFGFISLKMVEGKKSFVGIFYPKLKAQPQGEEFNTKGDSITFATAKMHFVGSPAKNGVWKVISEDFSTLDAAKTWVDGKLSPTTGA